MTHFYVYIRRPDGFGSGKWRKSLQLRLDWGGYIIYDRTMGNARDADRRVTELEKRESVTEAWHQTDTHLKAFY